ncbi:hypothetical protein [Halanaerobium praevalens]|uniref:Uncharacterized protein n=1 Tax=Halanaerobium praevalens (strain ATCC 33744 / DSM 2228 / GSL) TaxID=572479 RepID=E3DN92_HALPG|nr:hypothetical protein [Halanaerobium praevalens]ADO77511.1 hypothetical protein Hprae_1381 [Halanaerobium praevalens DSM 2228]
MDMKKQALRQFLRNQAQAQIPGTLAEISYEGVIIMSKEEVLTYNKRLSRLVLVITTFGGFWVIYKNISVFLMKIFRQRFYVKSGFSIEHIITSTIITSGFILLYLLLQYCYYELTGLVLNHDNKNKEKIIKAEEKFIEIFNVFKLYIILNLTILILFVIYNLFTYFNIIILISTIIIILIILICNKKKFIKSITNITSDVLKNKWYLILYTVLCLLLSVYVFYFGVFLMQDVFDGNIILEFSDEFLEITYNNKIPEETFIHFTQEKDKKENTEITINKDDFLMSNITVKQKPKEEKGFENFLLKEAFLLNNVQSRYVYKINLQKYLDYGKNMCIVFFSLEKSDKEIEYIIKNQIQKDKTDNLYFSQNIIKEDLD